MPLEALLLNQFMSFSIIMCKTKEIMKLKIGDADHVYSNDTRTEILRAVHLFE